MAELFEFILLSLRLKAFLEFPEFPEELATPGFLVAAGSPQLRIRPRSSDLHIVD